MASLAPELTPVLERLLADSERGGRVALDAVGAALGARAASYDDIDALFDALEAEGRSVDGPRGGGAEGRLRQVVAIARVLVVELGRTPRAHEIATRAGLSTVDVHHALALARIMQR